MSQSSRISNGWNLAWASFTVLKKNKQLLLFPVLSTISLIILIGSFIGMSFEGSGFDVVNEIANGSAASYTILFLFYLVNYFIIVFFNMALIHCTRLYFHGENPSVSKGLSFSMSRIGDIFAWAVLSATIGLLLNLLEESLGKAGQIISGLIGIVWSVATFFVVPVIAYERSGPFSALKRSASIMKEKWGESLVANFSFGLLQLAAIIIGIIPVVVLASYGYETLAMVTAVSLFCLIIIVFSATKMIFVTALYERITDKPVPDFDIDTLDSVFLTKEKRNLF